MQAGFENLQGTFRDTQISIRVAEILSSKQATVSETRKEVISL